MKKNQKNTITFIFFLLITVVSDFEARAVMSNDYFNSMEFECIKKNEIQSDTLYEFNVIDSFYILCEENRCNHLVEITYGGGFLWVLNSRNWTPDTIFQINPVDCSLVNIIQIPFNKYNWTQGIEYDSTSKGGPYFWLSIDDPEGIIYKFKVDDLSIYTSYYPPDDYPEALALHNDTLWITGQKNNLMFTLSLKTGLYSPLFLIKDGLYGSELTMDEDGNVALWMVDYEYSNGEWSDYKTIHKVNPYNGDILRSYKAPDPWPFGVCWENESPGGPYLWICDYETNKVYKVKEPVTDVNNDEISNKVSVGFKAVPNPFSEKTKLTFNLEYPSYTKITICNSLGYVLDVLNDEYLSEGYHEFSFDGSALASGTYYYVMQAGGKVETGQLVLIK